MSGWRVLVRESGVTDTRHPDGLETRTRDGVITVLRSVEDAIQPGTTWGYAAAWLYERLSAEELGDIVAAEGEAIEAFRAQIALGESIEVAIAVTLEGFGIDVAELVTREPVRSWPPEGWD